MSELRVAHTWELDPIVLDAARAMVSEAFDGDFGDADWEHGLGGVHALVCEDGAVIAHASVVMRRIQVGGGRALRCGYVEGVGVRRDRRRRGHGDAVMAAVERVISGAYDFGALGATDAGALLYVSRGWRRWEGRLAALSPTGVVATPDEEGAVYVFGAEGLDVRATLTCDWRDGDLW